MWCGGVGGVGGVGECVSVVVLMKCVCVVVGARACEILFVGGFLCVWRLVD